MNDKPRGRFQFGLGSIFAMTAADAGGAAVAREFGATAGVGFATCCFGFIVRELVDPVLGYTLVVVGCFIMLVSMLPDVH